MVDGRSRAKCERKSWNPLLDVRVINIVMLNRLEAFPG